MKSYGSVLPTPLQRKPSAIDVLADDDASPLLSPVNLVEEEDEETLLVGAAAGSAQREPAATPLAAGLGAWSSFWSVLFFSWCKYLSTVCAKRPLRMDDIWALDKSSMSLVCAQYFQGQVDRLHCVVRAFHVAQAGILFSSGLLTLASVACELVTPVAVFEVIQSAGNGEFESVWSRGALWTSVLLLARYLRSFLLGWADFLLNYALVRTTGPLNLLLLESVLSGKGHRHVSNGDDATNLFATDTKTVAGIIKVFHRTWSTPLTLVGLCLIFNRLVGTAASGVFLVCPIIYLVIQLLNIRETWLLREWIRLSDRRFAALFSMFDQILGVKLNAWQDRVLAGVEAVRRDEKRILRRHTAVRTLRMSLTWAAPSLNLIATGVILTYASGNMFTTPAQTFAAVTIFHAINDAFIELITVLRKLLEFRVAMARLRSVVPVARRVPSSLPFDFISRPYCHAPSCLELNMRGDGDGETAVRLHSDSQNAITITNASFSHPTRVDGEPLLDYVSLHVKRGEMIVVHGRVGSGKSVLLSAIAGLLHKKRGQSSIVGSIAYCSQSPWIQSTSVRDNILFGRTFDSERYWNVLKACELLPDIQALPQGDQTRVGSRSYVNLSSGQQSRIALARACYADADLYVLDSPLDSVDSIVQCEILLQCMGRLLQHKTIVLASHNPEVIMSEYVDRTVLMDAMEIVQHDKEMPPSQRRRSASSHSVFSSKPVKPFESRRSRLLANCDSLGRQRRSSSSTTANSLSSTRPSGLVLDPSVCLNPQVLAIQATKPSPSPPSASTFKIASTSSTSPSSRSFRTHSGSTASSSTTRRASASAASSFYWALPPHRQDYKSIIQESLSHSHSPYSLGLVIVLHFLTQVLATASIYSFSRWMSQFIRYRDAQHLANDDAFAASMGAFHIYVALVIASAVAFLIAAYATFAFARGVSDRLFHAMTISLLQARMSFFAETTVGKLLNRYCRDLQAVDSSLHDCVFALLKTFTGAYCALFASLAWMSGHVIKSSQDRHQELTDLETVGLEPVSSFGLWLAVMGVNVVLTSLVMSFIVIVAMRSTRPSSELFLLHREALSPIFTFVAEAIAGKSVIRAFGADQRARVAARFAELLDRVTRISWAIWCFEAWLAMRSLLIENVITGALLVGLICFGHDADADAARPATIGLLLLLLLNLRDDLRSFFAHWNALEKDMVCLQRVFEYIHLEPEVAANPELPRALVDPTVWPRSGALSFAHVDFQYTPYVVPGQTQFQDRVDHPQQWTTLRDVTFHVERGERVGIIGRSGAGKSSLAMALLRVNNPLRGVITLDGVDITRVDLSVLRAKIEYLPPNPVFFSGTVREYLDPFSCALPEADEFTFVSSSSPSSSSPMDDFELWSVLDKTGLKPSIRRVPRQLDASLEDVVDAWSNGERQLLCLARALLLRARVIFLDEATTATDQQTDLSVQRVVCQSLDPDMTLLCISHRIDAVLKFDKLLVMAHGQVEGFGTADELIASGDGEFFELLENAQLVY